MKKLFSLLVAASGAISAMAQDTTMQTATPAPRMPMSRFSPDSLLPRFVLDVNLMGGFLSQNLTSANNVVPYNGVNVNQGDLKFTKGSSFGFDAQFGYFFGHGCHWGIGTGILYEAQQGTLQLNNYHAEYMATDADGNVYRRVVSGSGVNEKLNITNVNIPLVLKYKAKISKRFGFTADIGALFNIQEANKYKTNASFDYEAIIQQSQSPNGQPWVYDNAPTPAATDFLITKAHYLAEHPGGDVNAYFAQQREAGYNVGLGVKANNTSGTVSYTTGSVGFLLQPSMSYYLSDHVALNLGLYYTYQSFKHDNVASYVATSGVNGYNTSLNNVTRSDNQSYGITAGVRFLFGKLRDTDGDGIPDKRDDCPVVYGLPQFNGCPDTDGDGIMDKEDSCVKFAGLAKFHGCPDTDGDGIQDKDDACPYQPGPAALHGCPDRDGDGIADKDDLCPDKAGQMQFHGCPDTDGDGVPDNEDQCPDVAGPISNHGCPPPPPPVAEETNIISTPILFELNKVKIKEESMPVLRQAAKKLEEDKEATIIVDGYTDNTGRAAYNQKLSIRRANAVKRDLIKMGANPRRIKIIGHGESAPAADNTTPEGRMQNRRAVMKLNVGN